MANVLKAEIGAVDFGPEGEDLVYASQGITLHPTQGGAIDTATLRLRKPAGGAYTIQPGTVVKLWLRDTSTNRAVWRYFIGVVARRRTKRIPGTNIKVWELDLQGANIALDSCVTDAAWSPALHLGAGSFRAQIMAAVAHFSAGADIAIDADTFIPDLYPGLTLGAKDYQGYSLREVLADISARFRLTHPEIVSTFSVIPNPTVPGAIGGGFGPPVLYWVDLAAAFVPRVQFSDVITGSYKPILVSPEFARIVESTQIVNWRESIPTHLPAVYIGDDPTSRAAYPNPFNGRHGKAWQAKPIKDDQSTDSTGAQAVIDNAVRLTANPRETVTFATFEAVHPGDQITISWALDSLADAPYVVADVTINFEIPGRPVYVVTAGARLLGIGEVGDEGYPAPPAEGHAARPDPPGTVTDSAHLFVEATGRAQFRIDFPASPSADVDTYLAAITYGGIVHTYETGSSGGVPHNFYTFLDLPPSTVVGVQVYARDVWGNLSDGTVPISPTTAGPPTLAPPTGIALNTGAFWGGFRWDDNGVVAAVAWTQNLAADHYDFQLLDHLTQQVLVSLITNGNVLGVEVGRMERAHIGGYDFRVRSVTAHGYPGAWSTPILISPPFADPHYPNTLAIAKTGHNRIGEAIYTLSWAIPPPTTNIYNGTPARFWLLVKDPNDQNVVFYQPNIPLTQSALELPPLPANLTYKARIGTVEAFGDFGTLSPLLNLTTAVPSLPIGQIPTMDAGDGASLFRYWAATSGPTPTVETTDVDTGNVALRMVNIASNGHSILESVPLAIPEGFSVKIALANKGPQVSNSWIMDTYISWRNAANAQISTTAIPVAAPVNSWVGGKWAATPPTGTRFAVIHLDAQNKLAGVADLLWNLRDWGLQAVAADIAPAAAIPSRLRLSSIENVIPNGALEIPDPTGTQPDGYTLTGKWEWLLDTTGLTTGTGVRSVRLGNAVVGAATIETPRFEFVGGQTNFLNYGFHFRLQAARSGGTVDYIRMLFYDKDGAALATTLDVKTNDLAANLAASIGTGGTWAQLDGMVSPNGFGGTIIPKDAVYASIKISFTTTGTTQYLIVDTFEGEYAINNAAFGTVQIRKLSDGTLAGWLDAATGFPGLNFNGRADFIDLTHGGSFSETIGSSNPASPVTGQRHYRTDLHQWIYWDGSRWLTEAEDSIDGWLYYPGTSAVVGNEISTNIGELINASLRSDYATRITRVELFGFIGTTGASNYYTMELRTFIGLATVCSFNTQGWTGGQWNRATAVTAMTNQPALTDYGLEWNVTKTGSPGNLRFWFRVFYKLVIT